MTKIKKRPAYFSIGRVVKSKKLLYRIDDIMFRFTNENQPFEVLVEFSKYHNLYLRMYYGSQNRAFVEHMQKVAQSNEWKTKGKYKIRLWKNKNDELMFEKVCQPLYS